MNQYPVLAETKNTMPSQPRWDTDPSLQSLRAWGKWITDTVLELERKVGADHSHVETSHDYMLNHSGTLASIEVDHAMTSPVVLLPGGDHDRMILMLVTATEAAAGDPRINIGQRGNASKYFADFGAGAWGLGYAGAVVGIFSSPFDIRATIPEAGTAGKLRVSIIELPAYTKLVPS